MKKVPLKIDANRQKLHIDRTVHDQPRPVIMKKRPSKQNCNIFPKLQQKEENYIDRQKYPSIRNISVPKNLSENSPFAQNPSHSKINSNHRPSSKGLLRRTSSSLAVFKNSEQFIENNGNISDEVLGEFVSLLQDKKIISVKQTNLYVSSDNFRTLLLYIITNKTLIQKIQTPLTCQTHLENFLSKHASPQIIPPSHKNHLKVCARTIQHVCIGRNIKGQTIKEMPRVAGVLMEELTALQKRKQALQTQINQRQLFLREIQHKNLTVQLEIQSFKSELQALGQSLQHQRSLLSEVQEKKQKIQNFVNIQSNLIAKGAAEYHKNLQIDLFQYADYLKHHPLGKKQFQPSIFYTEIQRMVQLQVKQTVELLTTEQSSQKEKQCSLNDFLKRLRYQYKLMIDQLNRAITQKTKYIKKFTDFMHRWYENYLAKKQYLSGLTQAFSFQAVTLQHLREEIQLYCEESVLNVKPSTPSSACITALKNIFMGIQKLVEIYGLGNSFY